MTPDRITALAVANLRLVGVDVPDYVWRAVESQIAGAVHAATMAEREAAAQVAMRCSRLWVIDSPLMSACEAVAAAIRARV